LTHDRNLQLSYLQVYPTECAEYSGEIVEGRGYEMESKQYPVLTAETEQNQVTAAR
jgi:hypothetical protein